MILPYHEGVKRIWSLPDHTGAGTYLLVSFLNHSEILYLSRDLHTVEQKFEGNGLSLEGRTVAAAGLDDVAIQVTQDSIRLARLCTADSQSQLPSAIQRCTSTDRITAAAIHPPSRRIVTVWRMHVDFHLRLAEVRVMENATSIVELGQAQLIPSEPSCVQMCFIQGVSYVLVATAACTLQVFRAVDHLIPIAEHRFTASDNQPHPAVCESMAVLEASCETSSSRRSYKLLCGMRDGCLLSYDIDVTLTGMLMSDKALRTMNME
jgi:hypothetical protein